MSCGVNTVDGIVETVGEHVGANEALARGDVGIGVDEPTGFGVIVPTLQVVEARLVVVDVAAVAQGIERQGAVDGGVGSYRG